MGQRDPEGDGGDHLDANTGRMALGDGINRLITGRVDQTDHSQQDQGVFNVGSLEHSMFRFDLFRRQGEHPLPLCGDLFGPPLPFAFIQRCGAAVSGPLLPAHG
ncbi:MAG: hypothetical protein R6X15_03985 [Pseudomonadota bacterium]